MSLLRLQNRLTLGLMGLDELHLRVLATASDDTDEKRNAQKGVPYKPRKIINRPVSRVSSSPTHVKGSTLGIGGAFGLLMAPTQPTRGSSPEFFLGPALR